ncbi:hypothetical protein [Alicyclobacillus fodiniaquatilis]|uniref:Uncharacterized protein n=1 Tax=Alicyclobacillus fodiniaquatilis TaxID=1661150 RepID=A0ABW4JH24_9BACL
MTIYDYGFDNPDQRHTFVDEDRHVIAVHIHRNYREPHNLFEEENDLNFDVTYFVTVDSQKDFHFPVGVDEQTAIRVAHLIYKEHKVPHETGHMEGVHQ